MAASKPQSAKLGGRKKAALVAVLAILFSLAIYAAYQQLLFKPAEAAAKAEKIEQCRKVFNADWNADNLEVLVNNAVLNISKATPINIHYASSKIDDIADDVRVQPLIKTGSGNFFVLYYSCNYYRNTEPSLVYHSARRVDNERLLGDFLSIEEYRQHVGEPNTVY